MFLIDAEKLERDIEQNYCLNCSKRYNNKWCDDCPNNLKKIMHIIFSQSIIEQERIKNNEIE